MLFRSIRGTQTALPERPACPDFVLPHLRIGVTKNRSNGGDEVGSGCSREGRVRPQFTPGIGISIRGGGAVTGDEGAEHMRFSSRRSWAGGGAGGFGHILQKA